MGKKMFIFVILMSISFLGFCNEDYDIQVGKIALNPVLVDEDPQLAISNAVLLNKLKQTVIKNGMSGSGFDDRFILTAHPVVVSSSVTNTFPQKSIYILGVTYYIGDRIDGNLFSSYYCEVKGLGESKDDSFASAFKKLDIDDPGLLTAIVSGKNKIIDYYNQNSSNIIKSANSLAASGQYEEAISTLTSIPSFSNDYYSAMDLAITYTQIYSDVTNMEFVQKAKMIWTAEPNSLGAQKVASVLDKLVMPSKNVIGAVDSLSLVISCQLAKQEEANWDYKLKEQQNKSSLLSQAIGAVQSVATAFCKNRPTKKILFKKKWW